MSASKPHSLDEIQERASLYALGVLAEDEMRELEAHLASGCEACRREVAAFTAVAAQVGSAADDVAPPAGLKQRVLDEIAARDPLTIQPTWDQPGSLFVRSGGLAWQEVAPAVHVKRLSVDQALGRVTQLIRMGPGTRFLPHRHVGVEESYILEGELVVEGVHMRSGDYCRAEPDSRHDDVSTERGCTFIAVSSLKDEYAV